MCMILARADGVRRWNQEQVSSMSTDGQVTTLLTDQSVSCALCAHSACTITGVLRRDTCTASVLTHSQLQRWETGNGR
jgi:hypothetical protein